MTGWLLLAFVAVFGTIYCLKLWWCMMELLIEWIKLKVIELEDYKKWLSN